MAITGAVLDLALIAVAVAGLWLGSTAFVAGASRVARRLGLSGLVVGLTVVAFGTSAPEFAVTLDAALTSKSDISVGNVVGSNVLNLGFVLGGAALASGIPVRGDLLRRDAPVLVATTLLAFAFLRDLQLTRLEGVALLVLLGGYLLVLVRTGSERVRVGDAPVEFGRLDAVRLVGGLVVVVASAHLLVVAASNLALEAGLSEWVVGVTVVAAGTSTPELATSVAAARAGRAGLSAGNLVGSCVFNVLGVLGLAAIVRPLPVAGAAIDSMWWLVGIVAVVVVLFWTRRRLSRAEGGLLVALNAVDWAVDLFG